MENNVNDDTINAYSEVVCLSHLHEMLGYMVSQYSLPKYRDCDCEQLQLSTEVPIPTVIF